MRRGRARIAVPIECLSGPVVIAKSASHVDVFQARQNRWRNHCERGAEVLQHSRMPLGAQTVGPQIGVQPRRLKPVFLKDPAGLGRENPALVFCVPQIQSHAESALAGKRCKPLEFRDASQIHGNAELFQQA